MFGSVSTGLCSRPSFCNCHAPVILQDRPGDALDEELRVGAGCQLAGGDGLVDQLAGVVAAGFEGLRELGVEGGIIVACQHEGERRRGKRAGGVVAKFTGEVPQAFASALASSRRGHSGPALPVD